MTPFEKQYEEAMAVFERAVVSTEPEEDNVTLVRLSCGHEAHVICFYPHTTTMPCAQCVNEYVREHKSQT